MFCKASMKCTLAGWKDRWVPASAGHTSCCGCYCKLAHRRKADNPAAAHLLLGHVKHGAQLLQAQTAVVVAIGEQVSLQSALLQHMKQSSKRKVGRLGLYRLSAVRPILLGGRLLIHCSQPTAKQWEEASRQPSRAKRSALLSSGWWQQEMQHCSSDHLMSHERSVGMQRVACEARRVRQQMVKCQPRAVE